jgi:hypothetical protein
MPLGGAKLNVISLLYRQCEFHKFAELLMIDLDHSLFLYYQVEL